MRNDEVYSDDTITIGAAEATRIEDLNDVLDKNELGRPLLAPGHTAGNRLIAPVDSPFARAGEIVPVLAAAGFDVRLDRHLPLGTHFCNPTGEFLDLAGRGIPHAFEPAEQSGGRRTPLPWEPLPPTLRRPVVAVLDSGVKPHPWWPDDETDRFLLDAATEPHPWETPVGELGAIARRHGRDIPHAESPDAGHATFIAGIIRAAAPSARILSVTVMIDDGKVRESIVTSALHWLAGYVRDDHRALDVVCMAFGREPGDTSDQQALDDMRVPLRQLADLGVALVASAGNDHTDAEIFPAAFPMVTAVSAGFGRYHAEFSNHGDWVDRYRDGVEILSTYPPDRWARWSGTSFSAAAYAGDLARPHVV